MLWLPVTVVVVYLLYKWSLGKNVGKYEAQGVKHAKPYPIVGSYPRFFFKPQSMIDTVKGVYDEFGSVSMYLIYFLRNPILVIKDPDLIREVLVKKFEHFVDRTGIGGFEEAHPETNKMLVNLRGDPWKAMRAGLSPAFTSGKLKNVMSSMNRCGPAFIDFITETLNRDGGDQVDVKPLLERYTLAVIAESVFGIRAEVFSVEETEFQKKVNSLKLTRLTLSSVLKFVAFSLFPKLSASLKLRMIPADGFKYFNAITNTILDQRKQQNTRGQDMLQLFSDLRNKAVDVDDGDLDSFEAEAKLSVKVDPTKMMDLDGVQQSAILFMLAGMDTTTSTLSLVTYFLATNPDVQGRAADEVDTVAAEMEDDNVLTYDSLSKLEYLDMVISETQRLAPIAPVLDRLCTKDVTLSNGVTIEKDTTVQIPVVGLHRDARYWKNPSEFDPERFSKENKSNIRPYSYMPFGLGPRNCIGMRFALMEVKVVLYYLLKSFKLEPSAKTKVPIEFSVSSTQIEVKDGNFLKFVPRN